LLIPWSLVIEVCSFVNDHEVMAIGSRFDRPIRVPELEQAYAKQNKK